MTGPATPSVGPLAAIRLLRSASGALLDQAVLHGQLAGVEWSAEKRRLKRLLLAALVGYAFLLCGLLALGALILALTWDTAYRVPGVLGLVAGYSAGAWLAWRRGTKLAAGADQAFAASREELGADIDLIRSRL